jgi:hypothetical protein
MTARRYVAVTAVFLVTGISLDPRVRAVSAPRDAAGIAREPARDVDPTRHPLGEAEAPPPSDLTVQVTNDRLGTYQVVLRRPGYLVSLRDEVARAAGVDWTAIRVAPAATSPRLAGRLIWETTKLDSSETTRGLVHLHGDAASLASELSSTAAPESAVSWKGKHASCTSQHDGLGGFTAFCRVAKGVRVTGVANVTAPRPLDDVWLLPGPSPFMRLDLARSPGNAEGRVVGLVRGATGIVLTVEASFPEGDEPTLVFHEAERAQPTPG